MKYDIIRYPIATIHSNNIVMCGEYSMIILCHKINKKHDYIQGKHS